MSNAPQSSSIHTYLPPLQPPFTWWNSYLPGLYQKGVLQPHYLKLLFQGTTILLCLFPSKSLSLSDLILFTYLFTCLLSEHYSHLFPLSLQECEVHRWRDLASVAYHLYSPGMSLAPSRMMGMLNKWMKEETLGVGDAWGHVCPTMLKLFKLKYYL